MDRRLSPRARRLILFALLSVNVCAVLNPGNFGTIDTVYRLQVARWIRLGEPPVRPEVTEFGIIGRGGVRHPWYGVGQSLVLIPFDAMVGATAGPVLDRLGMSAEKKRQITILLIAFLMQASLTFCALALAYEVLILFGFSPRAAMCGVLGLLFATSVLQYVQSAQENDLLLVLALCALYCLLRWRNGNATRWAMLAGAACGFAILVRLPSVLETSAFLLLGVSFGAQKRKFFFFFLAPVAVALAIDRWYQWYRFGELFSTYTGIVGRQVRPAGMPASWPFSFPFWKGFAGTFFSLDKSVFLFDPLLAITAMVAVAKWRSLDASLRSALASFAVLLLAYAAFYARYYDFGGDVAWGHRFVTLPVQLLALFAVPLMLRFAAGFPAIFRGAMWTLVGASVLLQAISTALPANVEIQQRERGYQAGVIVNRAINLEQMAAGREEPDRFRDIPKEWRTLYYLPFQLRFEFPRLAGWAIWIWAALVVLLCGTAAATLRAGSQRAPCVRASAQSG